MSDTTSMVILTSRGPRHSYFCRELARHYRVKGIVVDDRYHAYDRIVNFLKTNQYHPLRILKRILLKGKISAYDRRDIETEEKAFPRERSEFPEGVPVRLSPDPNEKEALEWIAKLSPDVIAVFGTRLIKDPLLKLARLGALNLHTGLSPYYRGGQCTFWALYHGDIEHIGVTVHYLSQKIDGGDIVFTARPEIEPEDTVRSLECKLVRLATAGMIEAVKRLAEGKLEAAPQKEKGRLFLSKEFTLEKRFEFEKKMAGGWLRSLLEERKRKGVLR